MSENISNPDRYDRKDRDETPGGTSRDEEVLAPGELPPDAKQGLANVYGDADRTAIDDPVSEPGPEDAAAIEHMEQHYSVRETGSGERYVEETVLRDDGD
ncbi:MAG: hypothetical protein ACQEXN_00360 [Actinomycetota bacterium]